MKRIKFLIFVYVLWRFLQDLGRSPVMLRATSRLADYTADRIEQLIFPPDTKRSRKRHAS